MLKKNYVKVMAAALSMALLVEVMPAGVRADEQPVVKESEQVFVPVEDVTLNYSSVKGFVNGYATVTTDDDKVGLIDVTGKEVIACGKYKNIELIEGENSILVQDADDHARLISYSEEEVKDFGACDSSSLYMYEVEESGDVFPTVRIVKGDINSFYKLDGTFVEEVNGDLEAASKVETELSKKLTQAGGYETVKVLMNDGDAEYCLCSKAEEKDKFYVVDSEMKEIFTVEGVFKCDNIYPGSLFVAYQEELPAATPEPTPEPVEGEEPGVSVTPEPEYAYTYELIKYDGSKIIGLDKGLENVMYSKENDCIIADAEGFGGWAVINADGSVKTKIGEYNSISIISGFDGFYLRAEKDSYENEEFIKHFYIINMKDNKTTDIGVYSEMSLTNYKGNNVFKLVPRGAVDVNTPGYKYIGIDGSTVYDSSVYKDKYDIVTTDGTYFYCYKYRKNNYGDIYGYSSADILKDDGETVAFKTAECHKVTVNGEYVDVKLLNSDIAKYTLDGKFLYTLEKSKYDTLGTVSDGYVPYELKGKWGILKLVDRSSLPTPTPSPTSVPTATPEPEATAAPTPTFIVYIDDEPEETATPAPVKAPAKAKISKVTAGKKKLTISLPKLKGDVKGYKLEYSLKKNFKGAKSLVVKKNKVVIKKLKSGKTYYVRVKAYALDGSKKVFSKKWSVAKRAKVK